MQYIANRSTLGGFSVLKERGGIVTEDDVMKYVIENMNNRFDKLDKKMFQLFYVGTGVGFLLGVATTIVVKTLIGG